MVGIQFRDFSNDQMVATLSTQTNQKSAEIIVNKPFFLKLRPLTEFVFGPYLSNGGGKETRIKPSLLPSVREPCVPPKPAISGADRR